MVEVVILGSEFFYKQNIETMSGLTEDQLVISIKRKMRDILSSSIGSREYYYTKLGELDSMLKSITYIYPKKTLNDLRYRSDSIEMPLIVYAAYLGVNDAIITLLKNGANINLQGNDGKNALMAASLENNLKTVDLLLSYGANINLQDNQGKSALILALNRNRSGIVNLLVSRGANINLQDNNGTNALMFASDRGDLEIVRLLLQNHANPNLQNSDGASALILASGFGRLEVVRLLLERGADSNLQDNRGNSALIFASSRGYVEVVRLLLNDKANPNLQSNDGNSALMYASIFGYSEIVGLLLKHGANPDLQDSNGNTALFDVLLSELALDAIQSMVKLLLRYRASIIILNNAGQTVRDIAVARGQNAIVELIDKHIAASKLKNLQGVRQFDKGELLPENVGAHIASFLTGEKGHIGRQRNILVRSVRRMPPLPDRPPLHPLSLTPEEEAEEEARRNAFIKGIPFSVEEEEKAAKSIAATKLAAAKSRSSGGRRTKRHTRSKPAKKHRLRRAITKRRANLNF